MWLLQLLFLLKEQLMFFFLDSCFSFPKEQMLFPFTNFHTYNCCYISIPPSRQLLFQKTNNCCSISDWTFSVPFSTKQLFFHSWQYTCYSILDSTLVVLFLIEHLLLCSWLNSCCSIPDNTFVVSFPTEHLLFHSQLTSCCSIPDRTVVVPFRIVHLLFRSQLNSCCSGRLKAPTWSSMILTKTISTHRQDWAAKLPEALWAYHTTWWNTTGYSLYQIVFVRNHFFLSNLK